MTIARSRKENPIPPDDTPSRGKARPKLAGWSAKKQLSRWQQERAARKRRNIVLGGIGVAVATLAIAGVLTIANMGGGGLNTSLHQHPHIAIFVSGSTITIPTNIGIDPSLWMDHSMDGYNQMPGMSSMSPLHTHESTGKVHLEMSKWHPCTLGDFFDVWGQPFERDKVLSFSGPVTLTVNGHSNDQYRDLVLQDGQQIVIRGG